MILPSDKINLDAHITEEDKLLLIARVIDSTDGVLVATWGFFS